MELSFTAAVIALTIVANLGGEVMSEVFGQYIAASYEDYLWTGTVPPVPAEPDPTMQTALSTDELRGMLDITLADGPVVATGGGSAP